MLLSRDDILKAADLPTEEVQVPEWGGSVLVRGLNGREAIEFQRSNVTMQSGQMVPGDLDNAAAKLAALCLVGEDGQRLFAPADVAALGEKSAAALTRVFTVALRLSGMGEETEAELAGNSLAAPSGGSPSFSPASLAG